METLSRSQLVTTVFSASALAIGYTLLRRRRRARRATVTQLIVYPVKSCRGIELEKAELDAGGIVHDREWMIVQEPLPGSNDVALAKTLTIRDYPRMATIQPSFTSHGKLMLCTDDGKSMVIERDNAGMKYKSLLWRTEVTGVDQGDAVASFLTAFLDCADKPVRLIRMESADRRLVDDYKYRSLVEDNEGQGGVARFSDWASFSVISTQSISWLNAQDTACVGMTNARFRMNIVVDAAEAFAEDSWHSFSIGEVHFRFLKQCGRCTVPITDANTGVMGSDLQPLKTLKKLRSGMYPLPEIRAVGSAIQAFFGVNVRHLYKPGQCISVGDRILVSQRSGYW